MGYVREVEVAFDSEDNELIQVATVVSGTNAHSSIRLGRDTEGVLYRIVLHYPAHHDLIITPGHLQESYYNDMIYNEWSSERTMV